MRVYVYLYVYVYVCVYVCVFRIFVSPLSLLLLVSFCFTKFTAKWSPARAR